MKRKSLLILLLLAAFAPWTTAQETLTVYDQGGSTTNSTIPIYGYNADYGFRNQFIIPADKLEAMKGGTLEKLTFYIQNAVTLDETFERSELYLFFWLHGRLEHHDRCLDKHRFFQQRQ